MTITTYPRVVAVVTGQTATVAGPDGTSESITAGADEDIRQIVVHHTAEHARRADTPLELITSGDRGDHRFLVGTDGEVAAMSPPHGVDPTPIDADVSSDDAPHPFQPATTDRCGHSSAEGQEAEDALAVEPAAVAEGEAQPTTRRSFITSGTRPERASWAARLGIASGPSRRELARQNAEAAVSQHWAGCRAIAVVNGKGGVGKTMTTAMLAAVLARRGGGNVLAWDNNDTRGTLGWRTEQGTYETTIRDLRAHAAELLSPGAGVSDISRFVHHQSADRYEVLRSNPELLAADQRLTCADFDELMRVAARFYRLVIFDSGNDESADRWLRMIDHADQLVIPTVTAPESAESAALLLDALRDRDQHSARLAARAVVVVTESEPAAHREAQRIADGFIGHVRAVETVPFDRALKSGALRYDTLRASTWDAWLRVAAATVADM